MAGTGSGCNGGSVITNEKLKVKTGRDYPQCNLRAAVANPKDYTARSNLMWDAVMGLRITRRCRTGLAGSGRGEQMRRLRFLKVSP